MQFTACYTKLENGYMGQLLEWPCVITEGKDLEECKECLIDAAADMARAFYDDGCDIPQSEIMTEQIYLPLDDRTFLTNHGGNHDIYTDGNGRYLTIKRTEAFDDYTVNALCKEAGIPDIFQNIKQEDK